MAQLKTETKSEWVFRDLSGREVLRRSASGLVVTPPGAMPVGAVKVTLETSQQPVPPEGDDT